MTKQKRVLNWVGKTISQTKVTKKLTEKDKHNYFMYECECSCGRTFTRSSGALNQAKKLGSNVTCPECRKENQSIRIMKCIHSNKATA